MSNTIADTNINKLIIKDNSNCCLESIFDGFYESVLDSDFERDFDIFDSENESHIEALNTYWIDLYDHDKYKDLVRKEYNSTILPKICDYLNDEYRLGIESIKADSIYSPKFYNFETDKLTDVTYTFNFGSRKELILKFKKIINDNLDEFGTYLLDNFKSRDGFMSFTDYTIDDWFDRFNSFAETDDDLQLKYISLFIDWLIGRLDYINSEFESEIDYDKSEIINNIQALESMFDDSQTDKNPDLKTKQMNFELLYDKLQDENN